MVPLVVRITHQAWMTPPIHVNIQSRRLMRMWMSGRTGSRGEWRIEHVAEQEGNIPQPRLRRTGMGGMKMARMSNRMSTAHATKKRKTTGQSGEAQRVLFLAQSNLPLTYRLPSRCSSNDAKGGWGKGVGYQAAMRDKRGSEGKDDDYKKAGGGEEKRRRRERKRGCRSAGLRAAL